MVGKRECSQGLEGGDLRSKYYPSPLTERSATLYSGAVAPGGSNSSCHTASGRSQEGELPLVGCRRVSNFVGSQEGQSPCGGVKGILPLHITLRSKV